MVTLNDLPSPSTAYAAYASVSASVMLLQTTFHQIFPRQLQDFLFSAFCRIFKRTNTSRLTLVVDQFDGMSRNDLFDSFEVYMSTKTNPKTKRLKVTKSSKEKHINIKLAQSEKVIDCFEGIEIKWLFVCEESHNESGKNNRNSSKIPNDFGNRPWQFKTKQWFELSFEKLHKDIVINAYIPFVMEEAKAIRNEKKVVKLHTLGNNAYFAEAPVWDSINFEHPSTFEKLAMEPSEKKALMDDLDLFVQRREYYKRVGRAWKRGYLLYGPPGTGKSSLIAAMANYLKFDVYDLQLMNVKHDSGLRKLLLGTANRSILVIEDIDCSVEIPDRKIKPESSERHARDVQFTLSGLLNFVDGLWSSCGDERIIIFTTNNKDKLDPALLRPGRMDKHIHMSYLSVNGFKILASNYLDIKDEHWRYREIEELIGHMEVTPAEVAEEFMKSPDVDVCLEGLVNFLNENQNRGFEDPNLIDESQINVIDADNIEGDGAGADTGIGDPVIPGLSIPGVSDSAIDGKDVDFGEGDDWDSDSEDDLQIVLNDNNDGQMSMGGLVGDGEDRDEDGDPLVIVADGDLNHQQLEEQDWGEDAAAAQGGDGGERKDLGDGLVKVNGVVQPPKPGYGYHNQFHSQFKYVRPGAPPIPGAAPLPSGGPPGQVRPPLSIGPTPGRGRGDWRPAVLKNAVPMQKGFHAGYNMPAWGNNTSGHGFGRGLDFTLPSHKTIFEVDIETFEEKPWRLPGIDISDFFNFGLNEDSWKDYCKQLEQHRLEATMQTKIRVYESGRTDQDYDPDMPPELAAAAGVHDIPADNNNTLGTAEVGQSDISLAAMRARTQIPTGRAIQVETGYGERLPSIDTRPPRMRDSDAIIEIVLQDAADDDSVNGNGIEELPEDTSREILGGGDGVEEDNANEDTEIMDSAPQAYSDRKRELAGRRAPLNKAGRGRTIGGNPPTMLEAPVQKPSSSREKSPVNPGLDRDERRRKGRVNRSPSKTRSGSTNDKRRYGNQKDESAESDGKHSPHISSFRTGTDTEDQYLDQKESMHDEQLDERFEMERVDIDPDIRDTHTDEISTQSIKKQKLNSQVEQPSLEEDDREESKAARSSENSKAISGSSRDYRNLPDAVEDEVVQDEMSTRMGVRKLSEDEHRARSKGREKRQDVDRHHMLIKERDDLYRKNWDSNTSRHPHLKADVVDRRKESDITDGVWQRKDEESHGRRARPEDTRKRDRGDDMGPRHRSKVREIERNDLDQYQLRKQLDNGSWRGYHDKEMGSRHRDRDDNLKTRIDSLDDLHSKRRKEDVHLKRDHSDKEELLHVHRENTSRRKRERDDIIEQRKKDDLARIRNDDQQTLRHKEEIWFQRDRVDRPRERDNWPRLKQSHEENLSKREREDVRGVKTGRTVDEKSWASHPRAKAELKGSEREYQLKDPGRHGEQQKRRDRVETESLSRHRGSEDVYSRASQPNNDERRSRQERPSARNDRAINVSDHHRMPENKHKEYPRKSKEYDGDHNSVVSSRRNQEEHNSQISERVRLRGLIEQGSGDQVIPVNRQSSRKRKEDAAASDEEQHDSARGRSKLERWTSHKEKDFSASTKLSSLNVRESSDQKKGGASAADAVPDLSFKAEETGHSHTPHTLADERDAGDQLNKDGEVKPKEDKHLDTVAKLKKRSERFKLPMPSEKEPVAVKKMDNEQLPPVQTESRTDAEIKQERPARKRRWTGN